MTEHSEHSQESTPPMDSELDATELARMQRLMRGALDDTATSSPDVLRGVQRKLRERSGGKFYEDGWSTSRHPPINTYLITSLMMLAILGLIYALLAPLSGEPVPVENTPQPVQIISPVQ